MKCSGMFKRMTAMALALGMCISMLSVNADAAAGSKIGTNPNPTVRSDLSYMDPYDPCTVYEVVDDNSPVRSAPNKSGSVVCKFQKDKFFYGDIVQTDKSTWIRVYSSSGDVLGYIFADHVKEHQHNLYVIFRNDQGKEISACECGYFECESYDGEVFRVDSDNLAVQLLAGNFSEETSKLATAVTITYDVLNTVACATMVTNPISPVACGIMTIISLLASIRDVSADVYYCLNDDCNPVDLAFDSFGVYSGVSSVRKEVKAFSVATMSQIEANRAVTPINDIMKKNMLEVGETLATDGTKIGLNYVKTNIIDGKETLGFYYYEVSGGSVLISSYNTPENLSVGQCFSIRGTLSAATKITDVTVGVYDEASGGTMLTGKSVQPNSTSFNVKKVDEYVLFNKLAEGTYWYRITAKTERGTSTVLKHEFTVGNSTTCGTKLPSISGENYPTSLRVGECYSIQGKISSDYMMSSVTIGVYSSSVSNDMITGETVNLNAYSYDVHDSDSVVYFNHLSAGTYWYRITATTSRGEKVLLSQKFTVD